ncbi:MAG: hypothetical protein E5W41_01560 [Mesorhizobium sp.]|nr:MAG: hypothetical protein E5W41_01560 [Mesorhizobium sp.]
MFADGHGEVKNLAAKPKIAEARVPHSASSQWGTPMRHPEQPVGLELFWLLAGPRAVELVVLITGLALH